MLSPLAPKTELPAPSSSEPRTVPAPGSPWGGGSLSLRAYILVGKMTDQERSTTVMQESWLLMPGWGPPGANGEPVGKSQAEARAGTGVQAEASPRTHPLASTGASLELVTAVRARPCMESPRRRLLPIRALSALCCWPLRAGLALGLRAPRLSPAGGAGPGRGPGGAADQLWLFGAWNTRGSVCVGYASGGPQFAIASPPLAPAPKADKRPRARSVLPSLPTAWLRRGPFPPTSFLDGCYLAVVEHLLLWRLPVWRVPVTWPPVSWGVAPGCRCQLSDSPSLR